MSPIKAEAPAIDRAADLPAADPDIAQLMIGHSMQRGLGAPPMPGLGEQAQGDRQGADRLFNPGKDRAAMPRQNRTRHFILQNWRGGDFAASHSLGIASLGKSAVIAFTGWLNRVIFPIGQL